jgi:hypothetical protein
MSVQHLVEPWWQKGFAFENRTILKFTTSTIVCEVFDASTPRSVVCKIVRLHVLHREQVRRSMGYGKICRVSCSGVDQDGL